MYTISGLADLHRHLDGSIRPETLAEFAASVATSVPQDLPFSPGMGLSAALSRFAFTLSLLKQPSAVERVAREMCEDAAREGVTALEIRFAPQLHTPLAWELFVDAALKGINGRAGVILCGLYGESPSVLERLVDIASSRPGVTGIDLAGGPLSDHRWGMEDYASAFASAAKAGLGRTVHAGEGRPPKEIQIAIEVLGADRIGHGTTLLDDPAVVDCVLAHGVTIEACVTSNWHTGAIARIDDHPIARWLSLGIPVAICTDNTLLSSVDAPTEYKRVQGIPGMTSELIERARQAGHQALFRRTGHSGSKRA